jgi:hypothetical protein
VRALRFCQINNSMTTVYRRDSRFFGDIVLTTVMLKVDAFAHGHLVSENWSFDGIGPTVIGQQPDLRVDFSESLARFAVEEFKDVFHPAVVVNVRCVIGVVAVCPAQQPSVLMADFARDEG